jgi:predicted Zn-dependent protease
VPEGSKALHFTRVEVPGSLTDYVGSGLVDGATSTDVEALTLNGLPAATSLSRTRDWNYRVFAIRVGSTTYRMTFAAREFSPATDAQFRQSAESFRRLTAEEIGTLRPTRVRLVTASSGDTAESLSARMAIDEPRLERFKVLNGLGASDRVFAGQRYKIVSE